MALRGAERGFLLLGSTLGNPERKPLTMAQLRTLGERVRMMEQPEENRELTLRDLKKLGYGLQSAQRILDLLEDRELLEVYLNRGARSGCQVLTRVTEGYPEVLRQKLALESPGCLWCRGDLSLLRTPMVALVGSRDLNPVNGAFAQRVGMEAARQGYTLVSGNARGADQTAQRACLNADGKVISIVADELTRHRAGENILYISEDSFDAPFSAQRALRRNRLIHSLGRITFVAQSALGMGGTWDGTTRNLRHGWSRVCCFDDGSAAADAFFQMGAEIIDGEKLSDFSVLEDISLNLFDQ